MKQQHIADSMLNRIRNFMVDLEFGAPALPNPGAAGATLDAALAAPVQPIPPDGAPEIAGALVTQGLGLEGSA
jgi:hypothetical protein